MLTYLAAVPSLAREEGSTKTPPMQGR